MTCTCPPDDMPPRPAHCPQQQSETQRLTQTDDRALARGAVSHGTPSREHRAAATRGSLITSLVYVRFLRPC